MRSRGPHFSLCRDHSGPRTLCWEPQDYSFINQGLTIEAADEKMEQFGGWPSFNVTVGWCSDPVELQETEIRMISNFKDLKLNSAYNLFWRQSPEFTLAEVFV